MYPARSLSVVLALVTAGCSCGLSHERDVGLDGGEDATPGMEDGGAEDAADDTSRDAAAPDGGCAAPDPLHPPLTGTLHPFNGEATELSALGVIVGRAALHPREESGLFTYTLGSETPAIIEDGPVSALYVDRGTGRVVYVSGQVLFALDPGTGERVRLSGEESVDSQILEVSEDGELVLYLARITPTPAPFDDERGVFVVRIDGGASAVRVVDHTRTGELRSTPRLAGRRVVFVAGGGGARALYSVGTDGAGLVRLDQAVPGGVVRDAPLTPSFILSPDGSRVLYVAEETAVGVAELHAVDTDGSDRASLSGALTTGGVVATGQAFALVTSDGTRALFRVDVDGSGRAELRSARLDGSDVHTIAEGEASSERYLPALTSDGTRVAFVAPDRSTIRVAPLTGGPATTIATGAFVADFGRSPRIVGERVVYVIGSDAASRLRSVRLDGGDDVLLHPEIAPGGTLERFGTSAFGATPDGRWITYVADLDGTGLALHRVRADGSDYARLSAASDPALSAPNVHDVGLTHVLYSQARGVEWALFRADLVSLEVTSLSERLPAFVAEDVDRVLESADGSVVAYSTNGPQTVTRALHIVRRDLGTSCAVDVGIGARPLLRDGSFDAAGDALYFRVLGPGGSSEVRRATTATCAVTTVGEDTEPPIVFSPSGATVLHARRVGGGPFELVATAPDGSGLRVLSDLADDGGLLKFRGAFAAFTPDGARVVYFGERGLYSVRVDGTERTRLADGPGLTVRLDSMCLPALPTAAGVVFVSGGRADYYGAVMRVPVDGSAPATPIGDSTWRYENDIRPGCTLRERMDGEAVYFRVLFEDGTRGYVEARVDGSLHRVVVSEEVHEPIFLGSTLVYESATDTSLRLRAVSLEGGAPITLHSGRSLYWAVPERDVVVFEPLDVSRPELYAVGVDGSGRRLLELPPGVVEDATVALDGRIALVTRGDDGVREIHALSLDAAPSLLARSCNGGRIEGLDLSRDGATVLVRADLRADGIVELFALPLSP